MCLKGIFEVAVFTVRGILPGKGFLGESAFQDSVQKTA